VKLLLHTFNRLDLHNNSSEHRDELLTSVQHRDPVEVEEEDPCRGEDAVAGVLQQALVPNFRHVQDQVLLVHCTLVKDNQLRIMCSSYLRDLCKLLQHNGRRSRNRSLQEFQSIRLWGSLRILLLLQLQNQAQPQLALGASD
jgi:hypothetical protein